MNEGHEYKLCIKEKIITDSFYRELNSIDFYDTSDEVKRRINHKIEDIVNTYPETLIVNDYINKHGVSIKRVKLTWFSNKQKHEALYWMDFIDCTSKDKYQL